MNVYCKIETQEDYDYFFEYDPDEFIDYPCLFNIDTVYLDALDAAHKGVGLLVRSYNPNEKTAEWVTVEEMKQLAFIRSLEL